MAADYSIHFQTHPIRIFLLLRSKIRGLYFNHLFNKPYGEIKLI
nr:MAG TPA: hypothetical protein [Caudoviricetes sp.]